MITDPKWRALAIGIAMLAASQVLAAAEQTFTLTVEHGSLPEAMRTIRVHEGDVVQLRWRADRPLTLHLHGYDLEWRVLPGQPVEASFTAYATGRFPIEIHQSDGPVHQGAPLAALEVYPRAATGSPWLRSGPVLNGALPSFEIEGSWLLVLVRGLTDAGLLSAFGTLMFRALVLPVALNDDPVLNRRLLMLSRAGLGLAVMAGVIWLVLEAGDIADAGGFVQSLSAAPAILSGTLFGHLIGAQVITLLAAALALGKGDRPLRWGLATGLSAIATGLQAGHGHAMAMYNGPSLLVLSGVLHLLATGAWLGGLLPLTLVVRMAPPRVGARAAQRFSPVGQFCVGGLILSAGYQFWVMIGGIAGLVGTAYGWMIAVKSLLLAALLGFAATNRYRLVPSLLRTGAPTRRRALQLSIAWETGVGLLVVLAAGLLSGLPPAMHIQPVWPFSEQLSLVTLDEDPSFRAEAVETVAALGVACVLLAAGLLARRATRWAALAGAAIIAWFAVPHLDLFLVTAYPTSFYHSTSGFSANAIANGAELYPRYCAGCHGATGRGNGPDAKGLPLPPADLTVEHLWAHSDGELFWWLSHGIEAPEGARAMPGFSEALSEDQRWDLIDYIRAHNAGLMLSRTGSWSPPVRAPDLPVTCADRTIAELQDLRGRIVRLVFASTGELETRVIPQGRSSPDVTSILVTGGGSAPAGSCTASGPDAWRAYGVASATAVSDLPGTQFLVDGAGFLRLIQRPSDEPPGWNDPEVLESVSREVSAHPISDASLGQHQHH
jgi:putative copper export protein/mono/diheme cytochrome c family protein